jgi:hypothetical protein
MPGFTRMTSPLLSICFCTSSSPLVRRQCSNIGAINMGSLEQASRNLFRKVRMCNKSLYNIHQALQSPALGISIPELPCVLGDAFLNDVKACVPRSSELWHATDPLLHWTIQPLRSSSRCIIPSTGAKHLSASRDISDWSVQLHDIYTIQGFKVNSHIYYDNLTSNSLEYRVQRYRSYTLI